MSFKKDNKFSIISHGQIPDMGLKTFVSDPSKIPQD